ncbi:PTS transporter subunit EIIC [Spiroplasma endosymbiont of Crioceris asparagi]|uniref:PTS transporter subunit EIIC n=1 Tax=Spiroplasma endosymbiont of Crioceris asparagi TaxID=3066286 RepID=UPI0030CEB134
MNSKQKTKTNVFAQIMPTLSKLGKSFLLPIALLPIAGLFLAIGATITAKITNHDAFFYVIGDIMNKMGNVAFANLPVFFAIAVAISFTGDSGVAALTAVLAFLVFNAFQTPLIKDMGADKFKILFIKDIDKGLFTDNLGVHSLNTGVFAAIFVGAISAKMYNKFHKTQLPAAIGFFSGSKLVPIVTFFAIIPLSIIFLIIWPFIGKGLSAFGTWTGSLPNGVSSLIYEIIERSLVPFGLHHVYYSPLWWTGAGGDLLKSLQDFLNKGHQTFADGKSVQDAINAIINNKDASSPLGDQTIIMWIIGHSNLMTFADAKEVGLNLGQFMTGKFGFMLLGLPAAAVAMWLTVPKENRKQVMGIYFSAAFCCMLTGITEPLEYTFLFVAPWLFYGVHMPLASIAFFLCGLMQVHIGQTVSGGLIDFVVFGIVPWAGGNNTNAIHIFWIAPLMGILYFFAFSFAIRFANSRRLKAGLTEIELPGFGNEMALKTKADFIAKKEGAVSAEPSELYDVNNPKAVKAFKLIACFGGEENIENVDSCASRLRITVVDGSKVDVEGIKALGGCNGVLVKGKAIQAVYGGEQEVIKPYMKEILVKMRNQNN